MQMIIDLIKRLLGNSSSVAETRITTIGPKITLPTVSSATVTAKEPTTRITNDAGIALIKQFEGCILTSYPDPASPLGIACARNNFRITAYMHIQDWDKLSGSPWTIGYGYTGPEIVEGVTWTQEVANARLRSKLVEFEQAVNSLVPKANDNQFSALVCFTYNVGPGNLAKLVQSSADLTELGDKLLDYDKAKGRVLAGLTRRRQAERALFKATGS